MWSVEVAMPNVKLQTTCGVVWRSADSKLWWFEVVPWGSRFHYTLYWKRKRLHRVLMTCDSDKDEDIWSQSPSERAWFDEHWFRWRSLSCQLPVRSLAITLAYMRLSQLVVVTAHNSMASLFRMSNMEKAAAKAAATWNVSNNHHSHNSICDLRWKIYPKSESVLQIHGRIVAEQWMEIPSKRLLPTKTAGIAFCFQGGGGDVEWNAEWIPMRSTPLSSVWLQDCEYDTFINVCNEWPGEEWSTNSVQH